MVYNYTKNHLLIVMLLFTALTSAQIQVENKIIDFSLLAPIENASIYVKNTTIGTVSNADGRFVLQIPKTS